MFRQGGQHTQTRLDFSIIHSGLFPKCSHLTKQGFPGVYEEYMGGRQQASFLPFPQPFLLLLAWNVARRVLLQLCWTMKVTTKTNVRSLNSVQKYSRVGDAAAQDR